MTDATWAAAEENPDVLFIGVDQYIEDGPANYVGIQFREDEAGFLVGAMAALMTETDMIAGVYTFDIPLNYKVWSPSSVTTPKLSPERSSIHSTIYCSHSGGCANR
jgi:hypothetical protein